MTDKNRYFLKPIRKAIIFAAGRGERMRDLTIDCPKPMISFCGKSMIKRLIEKCEMIGIEEIIINTHYHAKKLVDHLSDIDKPRIIFSHEDELLDTGGGAKKAMPLFAGEDFLAINGDMIWHENDNNLLQQLIDAWQPKNMDCLLSLYPTEQVTGFSGNGDYHLEKNNHLRREKSNEYAPYVFAGARICKPSIFDRVQEKDKFSFLDIFDIAEENHRLYGFVFGGHWFHISTPEMLIASEKKWRDLEAKNTHLIEDTPQKAAGI